MICLRIYNAQMDVFVHKNATFSQHMLYFARESKKGHQMVVRSNEGHWIELEAIQEVYNTLLGLDEKVFQVKAFIHMRDRRKLNNFRSAEDYLESGDANKHYYRNVYRDKDLYTIQWRNKK